MMTDRPKPALKSSQPSALTDDQAWQKLTAGVRPLKKRKTLPRPAPKQAAKTDPKTDQEPARQQAHQPASPKQADAPPARQPADLRLGQQAGLDNRSRRLMKRGGFEIDARLDLHGLTAARAHDRLIRFIEQAAARQFRTVLIITGKGRAGEGVLRREVPAWLKEPPLADRILALEQATGQDGGGGALYVRLRRKRERVEK